MDPKCTKLEKTSDSEQNYAPRAHWGPIRTQSGLRFDIKEKNFHVHKQSSVCEEIGFYCLLPHTSRAADFALGQALTRSKGDVYRSL